MSSRLSVDEDTEGYDTIGTAEPRQVVNPPEDVLAAHRRSRSLDVLQAATMYRTSYSSLATADTYINGSRPATYLPKAIENIYSPYSYHQPIDQDGIMEQHEYLEKMKKGSGDISPSETSEEARDTGPPVVPPVGPAQQPPTFSRIHEVAFIINVCLAQFLSLATLAQTVAPLLILGDSLHVQDLGALSWFTAAFSLTVGTLLLPSGRLGDMYGHKKIFMGGWAWITVWSVVTGFSYTQGRVMLSACRAMQGIGVAAVVPNAMALIGRTWPMGMKRNLILSCFGACGPTGFVVGAVFSSIFAQLLWWPWIFWALAIAAFFVFAISYVVIPSPERVSAAGPSRVQTFDYWGAFLGVSGLVLINFALNQAPIVGWSKAYILNLFFLGWLLMVAFVIVEYRFAIRPLVPIKELNRDASFVLLCVACGWGSHGIWLYYFYLFLETLRGKSALLATAMLAPVAVTGVAFALSTPFMIRSVGPAWTMATAMLCFSVGAILLATAPINQSYWSQTFWSVVIMPGGMNLSFPSGMILLSNAMPREHQGIAASFVSTIVNYSISCGLGLAATIVVEVSKKRHSVEDGYRGALYLGIGLSLLGLLISMFFVWKSRKS